MEKFIIEKEIKSIDDLFARKQFIGLDKKILYLLREIKEHGFEYNEYYIHLKLLFIELITKSGKPDIAISELEKELSKFPYNFQLLFKAYELYTKIQNIPKAKYCIELLIALRPDEPVLRINYINLLINTNDNSRAIFEIKNFFEITGHNTELCKILILLLGQECLYSEQFEKIKMLQKLLPDDISLIIEEINTLTKLGNLNDVIKAVNSLLNFKLENNQIDDQLISMLSSYSSLFAGMGNKELLADIFIKIIANHFQNLSSQNKAKIEKISRELKLGIIYHFFCNPKVRQNSIKTDLRFIITNDKMDSYDIIDNIMFMYKNMECITDSKLTIKKFLEKTDLCKLIPKDLISFLYLLENTRKE